jgi:hypothetical protein
MQNNIEIVLNLKFAYKSSNIHVPVSTISVSVLLHFLIY